MNLLKSKKKILILIITVAAIMFLADFIYYFFMIDISKLKNENPQITAFMKYRISEWQGQGRKINLQYNFVPISQISPYLIKAVVTNEDPKFWLHKGFCFGSIFRKVIVRNIKERKLKYGASSITQQLAKNLYLSPSKNIMRKINEAILTLRLEKELSKVRILELYLNVIEWGMGIFGIEAASRHYYNKTALTLNANEASKLANILVNPLKYHPF